MKYKKYKLVFLDPTANSGWQSEKELKEFTPEECVIEAYVYSKDKKIVKTFASIQSTRTIRKLRLQILTYFHVPQLNQ